MDGEEQELDISQLEEVGADAAAPQEAVGVDAETMNLLNEFFEDNFVEGEEGGEEAEGSEGMPGTAAEGLYDEEAGPLASQDEEGAAAAPTVDQGDQQPGPQAGEGEGYEDDEGGGDDQPMEEDGGGGEGEAEAEEGEAEGPGSEREKEEADQKARILSAMTEEQLNRYEAFRRSALPRAKMKKLLQQITGVVQQNDKALIAMCGIGKMFVGELIEMARHLASLEGHTGPLLPRHIQRSYQQLDRAQRVPHLAPALKRMFK